MSRHPKSGNTTVNIHLANDAVQSAAICTKVHGQESKGRVGGATDLIIAASVNLLGSLLGKTSKKNKVAALLD